MSATTLVGLDVGSTSIRAVEASISRDRPTVNNFGQVFLPPDAVVGGVVKDDRAVTAALRHLWTAHTFTTKNVALGVTHQQVIVREIDLPKVPAKDLRTITLLVRDAEGDVLRRERVRGPQVAQGRAHVHDEGPRRHAPAGDRPQILRRHLRQVDLADDHLLVRDAEGDVLRRERVRGPQVIVREIDLPKVPAKDLRQALPFLVREVLPLPVEQALLDFYPLPTTDKPETTHGLLVAVPKEPVIDTVRAVENAGLHVDSVDLACFAALRASAHLAHDTEALLDIGANGTNIVIHTDGTPKVVRTVPRGGAEITKMLATRLGLTTTEAETIKCRVGLRDDENAESAGVADEALRPLVTEIRSSFNYYSQSHPGKRVRRLALVGGAALLPGLAEKLTRDLGVPAFLSDPLQRVYDVRKGGRHDALGRFRSSAAVSIGLTLGAA